MLETAACSAALTPFLVPLDRQVVLTAHAQAGGPFHFPPDPPSPRDSRPWTPFALGGLTKRPALRLLGPPLAITRQGRSSLQLTAFGLAHYVRSRFAPRALTRLARFG